MPSVVTDTGVPGGIERQGGHEGPFQLAVVAGIGGPCGWWRRRSSIIVDIAQDSRKYR